MQGLLKYSRLVLALALILLLESSVQGYPMQKARYQWVRCNSANCIEEQGPEFDLGPDDTKRIIPLKTGSS
ncbi:serglycin [Rhynchocyon petersi]